MSDDWLSFREASATLPGKPHHSTIRRWATEGLDGRKLKVLKVGGRFFTKRSWLTSFCQEATEATTGEFNQAESEHQA
jgi:hypothetical protein